MRVSLQKVRLDNGGYDSTGQYWGLGPSLYRVQRVDGERLSDWWDGRDSHYFRASSRPEAKAKVLKLWPDATFYR